MSKRTVIALSATLSIAGLCYAGIKASSVVYSGSRNLTIWLTCRRDRQDSIIIVARNLANRAVHTSAEGGQVEPVLGSLLSAHSIDCRAISR